MAIGEEFGGEYSAGMDDATQSFEGPLGYGMGYGAEGANQAGDVKYGASMSVDDIPDPSTGLGYNYTVRDALIDVPLGILTAGLNIPAKLGIGAFSNIARSITGFTSPSSTNPALASINLGDKPSVSVGNFSIKKGGEELGSGQLIPSIPSTPSRNIFDTVDPEGAPEPYKIRRVAEGGGMVNLRNQANMLAAQGRGGDTMLMHMRPDEVAGLASLGGVTRNPVTGLPEGFLMPALGAAFAPGLLSGAFGGGVLGTALATGLGAGGGQALQSFALGEDDPLKKGMTAGLTAGIGSAALGGLSQALGGKPTQALGGKPTDATSAALANNESFGEVLGSATGTSPAIQFEKPAIDISPGLTTGAQKVTESMLNNPLSTGASFGALGGTVADSSMMPEYSGPMPGEGTSGGSYRGSGETFQGSPLTRTGLAQQDLTQYGFGPEGMFFGEGVYRQKGGAVNQVDDYQELVNALELREKLLSNQPPFQKLRKEITEVYDNPTAPYSRFYPFSDEDSFNKYFQGRGRLMAQEVDKVYGPGSTERAGQSRRSQIPIGMQEGGSLEEESVMAEGIASIPSGGQDEVALMLTQEAVDAVRGEHPQPEVAIESFVSYFGPEAFDALRTLVIQEESARRIGNPDGLIAGEDGGRDDIQRGNILNGDFPDQEINFSGGEYIFSADDVALMGDGNTEAGARRLDNARANLRKKATGTTERPSYMGEGAAEEILEEAMVG